MLGTDITERLREALDARFIVEREIGRGGMATVFLAEERQPARQVAIKVLEPTLATGVPRERFLREVEFASQLTHPNIVPIFHAGEAEGFLYYVMPYIDGHSLRIHLSREGRMPLERALHFINEVGDALHYAHGRSVVHRDIKPENILLSNGHAMVADFGVARALCVACGDNITIAGVPIGTPGYMSPEQGSGEEVDARTDVYSLGAVLYEMLTGRPAFRGATIEAIIAARYTQPTPTLRAAGWTLSNTIDTAVERAMQLDPHDRFATVADFLGSLRGPVTPQYIPTTLPAFDSSAIGATSIPPQSLAVLPFANLSADPDNEYFSDGITEDIITQVSRIDHLRVISRTSVLRYKNTDKSIRQIGAELGVRHILEGTVRRSDTRVRVTAQLIDVNADEHVWAERFDRELTDIFAIQSEIAERIAEELRTSLSSDERRQLSKKPTDNLEAHNLYLQGRYYWAKFTPAGIARAIDFFERAARVDPAYAAAYAGLADAYLLLTTTLGALPPREGMPKAEEAARRAVALDPSLADAHSSLAAVHDFYHWDWKAAGAEHERALELDPDNEKAHIMYGFHLLTLQQFDLALRMARKAEQICPVSLIIATNVATHLYKNRLFEAALEQLEHVTEMDPTFPVPHVVATWTYLQLGRAEDAIAAARRAAELTDSPPQRRAALGCALAAAGRIEEAEAIYDALVDKSNEQYVSALDLALLASHLDERDLAFEWLDKAVDDRAPWLTHLRADPIWDRLRDDARFSQIVERVRLP